MKTTILPFIPRIVMKTRQGKAPGAVLFCKAVLSALSMHQPIRAVSFVNTGPLNTPRELQTATPLQNGKVLVAGGDFGSGASAKIYDPATGIWTATGPMNTPFGFHTHKLRACRAVLSRGSPASPRKPRDHGH